MSKITDFVITNFEMLAKIYGIVAIIVCVAVILFMIWVVKAEDEERKLYGDDYYLPEMEELPSTAETVIFTLMLAVGYNGCYAITASDYLSLRAGAGTQKTELAQMKKNETVTCYGYYTDVSGTKWLLVVYKGTTGFASSKYLKKK